MSAIREERINFNHIGIALFQRIKDGECIGYVAKAKNSYVFYDPMEENYEQESPDSPPIKVTHYRTIRIFPQSYDINSLNLIAVPRHSVNSKYIF